MRRRRITITLNSHLLDKIDRLIDNQTIRNRSHAIESIIHRSLSTNVKKAVILAGGKGINLRPYTYEMPKPLLPIKGKAILDHLIARLKDNGIDQIILCLGYLGEKIKLHCGNGERYGVKISYSEENEPLQTGGALAKIYPQVADEEMFLVVYGDIIADISYVDLADFHQKQNTLATIALTTVDKPAKYGQLQLHGVKLVKFFTKDINIHSYLVNTGIYVFSPEIFSYFPLQKSFFLEDVIKKLIPKQKVSGFVFEGKWFDVGNPEDYECAIKDWR